MKAEKGMKCVICGKPAVERVFDGVTAWCEKHLESWKEFYSNAGQPVNKAFILWRDNYCANDPQNATNYERKENE